MSDIDAVYMCPQCGSSYMDLQSIGLVTTDTSASAVQCRACGWVGTENQLLAAAFQHSMGSATDLTQALINDLRNTLALKFAETFGSFLIKWGFIEQPVAAPILARYVSVIAKAVMVAVIRERGKIEVENKNVS